MKLSQLIALLLAWWLLSSAQRPSSDGSDEYFRRGPIHELQLVLSAESEQRLRDEPREYAQAQLWVDGKCLAPTMGVKLKGAAGSFQNYDERPALTLRLDKFDGRELFHGLEKFHLNNSVQDESYLCEWLGSEIFRSAGYPATRVQHARLRINQRELGLVVVKEGFDRRFLARWYDAADGNLYDGGFCSDVDAELERDFGKGPKDRSDLLALASAAQEPDMLARWKALEALVRIPRFLRFMALEQMLGHWDGYTLNSNNYRLYFVPGAPAEFLPHGMDQLWGDPEASVLEMPTPLLSSAVMKKPEWRKLYRKELREWRPLFEAKELQRKLEPVQARIQTALRKQGDEAQQAQRERYQELCERIQARSRHLANEVNAPEPKALVFRPGIPVRLHGWRPQAETEEAVLEEQTFDRARWMNIRGPQSAALIASYRRSALLEQGRYRLEALVRTEKVLPLEEPDAPTQGAGLRLSGGQAAQSLQGSATQVLQLQFEVSEAVRDVELILELRARTGQMWVRADSIQLTRVLGG